MKINVTETHIKQGTRGSCDGCPVSLALKEATGERWEVGAVASRQWTGLSGLKARQIHSLEMVDWIKAFDKGEKVKPFSFVLDPETF